MQAGIFLVLFGAVFAFAFPLHITRYTDFRGKPLVIDAGMIVEIGIGAGLIGALLLLVSLVGVTKQPGTAPQPLLDRPARLVEQLYRWVLLLTIITAVCGHSVWFLWMIMPDAGAYLALPLALKRSAFLLTAGPIYIVPALLLLLAVAWIARLFVRRKASNAVTPPDDKEP